MRARAARERTVTNRILVFNAWEDCSSSYKVEFHEIPPKPPEQRAPNSAYVVPHASTWQAPVVKYQRFHLVTKSQHRHPFTCWSKSARVLTEEPQERIEVLRLHIHTSPTMSISRGAKFPLHRFKKQENNPESQIEATGTSSSPYRSLFIHECFVLAPKLCCH
jgi:hypothetical protein